MSIAQYDVDVALWSPNTDPNLFSVFQAKHPMPRATEQALHQSTLPTQIAKALSLFLILSVSSVGNILILVTIGRDKTLHTKTSVFVVCLAIADLLIVVTSFSFIFVTVVHEKWSLSQWYCELIGVLFTITCAASMITVGCIAIDRYNVIVKPLHYAVNMTDSRVGIMVTWTWVHAIALSLLPLSGWTEYTFVPPQHLCTVDWKESISFSVFAMISTFCLPLVIMAYCYYFILKTAREQRRRVAILEVDEDTLFRRMSAVRARTVRSRKVFSETSSCRLRRFKRESKATMTILVVIGTFVVCWLPFVVTSLMVMSGAMESIPDALFALSSWMICLNSALNPLIYGIMNKQYRGSFVKYLCCRSGTHTVTAPVQPLPRIKTISDVLPPASLPAWNESFQESFTSSDSAIEMDSNLDISSGEIRPPSPRDVGDNAPASYMDT